MNREQAIQAGSYNDPEKNKPQREQTADNQRDSRNVNTEHKLNSETINQEIF